MRNPQFAAGMAEARELLKLGGPIVAAQLAGISMNFVDTVMAGRLSAQNLAAIAVGGSLWMPLVVFCMGTLSAVSPNVSHAFGAETHAEAGRHLRQGLWLSLILGLLAMFLARYAETVLRWMQIDAEIIPTAAGYLRAVSWGLPAICAFTVLRCFSEGVSQTKPIMWISVLALLANIVGNYAFMYGRFGCPALGAIGTGVATAIVMWFELACVVGYIALHRVYAPFGAFDRFEWPDLRELATLLKLGMPMGASVFMEGSLFATVALLMGTMGTHVVAGHQVAINVASVTFMVPLGLAMAISVRVGQSVGAGNLPQARRAGLVGMALAVGFMSLTALTMWTLPHAIAALYTSDALVHDIAVRLLAMAAVFQISDGLQVSSAFALRGLKDTRVTMVITLIAYWGVGLPLGYVLGITWNLGPQAMWIGLIVGLTVAGILLHVRFRRVTRAAINARDPSDAAANFADVSPTDVPVETRSAG